jgi:arsenite/tail-anchored protein-transporting ATPase
MNDDAAVHPPGFLVDATCFLFFTGRGDVGKTSVACAAALVLVDSGKSVLLAAPTRHPTSMRYRTCPWAICP